MRSTLATALILASTTPLSALAEGPTDAKVVEIATMELADGVAREAFAVVDARVEADHVSQQPGFVSRETGYVDGRWVAIVYWASINDAEASMEGFSNAEAAAEFMSMVAPGSIEMTRYELGN